MIRTAARHRARAFSEVCCWNLDRSCGFRGNPAYAASRRTFRRADRRYGRALCAEALSTIEHIEPPTRVEITIYVDGEHIVIG